MERERPIASVSPFFLPVSAFIFYHHMHLVCGDCTHRIRYDSWQNCALSKTGFLLWIFLFLFLFIYLFFFGGGGFLFLTRRVATPRHLFCGPSIVYVFLRFFDCCADWDQSCDGWTCFDRSAKAERLCALSDRVYSFLYFARAHRVRHYYFKYSLIYSIKKKKKRFCLPCLTRE